MREASVTRQCGVFIAALAMVMIFPMCAGEDKAEGVYLKMREAALEILVDGRLMGSGWLASEAGYAFTASHVVPGTGAALALVLSDGRQVGASVVARDPGHDALLLRVDDPVEIPVGLPFARENPRLGERLFLLGAPIFRHRLFFTGTVAHEGTSWEWLPDEQLAVEGGHVQAATPKGVSGGAWVNERGEVVGVQSGMIMQGEGMAGVGWFGPAAACATLLAEKRNVAVATLGEPLHEMMERPAGEIHKYPAGARGIVFESGDEKSPACVAGLKRGDLIVAIGDHHPTSRDEAYRIIRGLEIGSRVTLRYLRPGEAKEQQAVVTVGAWKASP